MQSRERMGGSNEREMILSIFNIQNLEDLNNFQITDFPVFLNIQGRITQI